MQRLIAVGIGLLVVPLLLADEAKKDAKFDESKLLGDWTYVSGKKMGEDVEKDHLQGKVTFAKDTITLPGGPDQKFVMAYKIDAKSSPAKIDLEIKDGPVKEGKAQGIISLDGDELKLCYIPNFGDAKRPSKFESTKDNGAFLFVLKKAK